MVIVNAVVAEYLRPRSNSGDFEGKFLQVENSSKFTATSLLILCFSNLIILPLHKQPAVTVIILCL